MAGLRLLPRELLAGGAASAAFLGLQLASPLVWWLALPLSVAVYVAARLLLPAAQVVPAPGAPSPRLATIVESVRAKAARLDQLAGGLPRAAVAAEVTGLARVLREIASELMTDPRELPLAEAFLNLHLPRALSILERYATLVTRPLRDEAAQRQLADCERTLQLVHQAFATHYRGLVEHDLQELDIDRQVAEELLRLEEDLTTERESRPAPRPLPKRQEESR